ncbi:MAG: HEAT repeat domain-containing protein, partial [Syntrophobacteria bacterium]
QAVTQGLISSEFEFNDASIRFLGKRILEITYGTLEEDHKQALHERIGTYQETLYNQRLLPSAATLAYHFKRSANQEKASIYEQFQAASNSNVFNATEAVYYTGRPVDEVTPKAVYLDPDSLPLIPDVFRSLLLAVRNLNLYPPGSKAIVSTNNQAKETVDRFLEKNELLSIFQVKQALMVNGQKIDVSEFKSFAAAFIKFLARVELKGMTLKRGLTDKEFQVLLEAFSRSKPDMIDEGFWQRFVAEQRLIHVELNQVHYTIATESAGPVPDAESAKAAGVDSGEHRLDAEDLAHLPEIIRCLLNAVKSVRLYPLTSKAFATAVDRLMQTLRRILQRRPVLSLAHVDNSLLVNSEKIDTSEFESLAEHLLKFLDSIMVTNLAFLQHLSTEELKTFIGALGQLPDTGMDSEFWVRFARDHGLSAILFDPHIYEARIAPTLRTTRQSRQVEVVEKVSTPMHADAEAKEAVDTSFEEPPKRMSDLLLSGEIKQVKEFIKRLFRKYAASGMQDRQAVIGRCKSVLDSLNIGLQNQFAKLLVVPLLAVFSKEEDPILLRDLAALLQRIAANFIQFAEYPLAGRIFLHLRRRQQQLVAAKHPQAGSLAKILEKPLDPKTGQLLAGDFKSIEPSRQQDAAQLLGSLGGMAVPLLVDIIKGEDDLRVRQIAASLLAELGPNVAKLLKRELVLEINAEQRVRLLEVIDTVTRDLKTELAYAIGDGNPRVRQAAFSLVERLDDEQMGELLLDYANSQNADVAVAALKQLGRLRPKGTAETLISLLKAAKKPERLISCCQALGQVSDQGAIEPLGRILAARKFFRGRRKYPDEVRAAAAAALAEIDHPRVAEIFAPLVDDRDPRVKELACLRRFTADREKT